jgi:hypothetical protein
MPTDYGDAARIKAPFTVVGRPSRNPVDLYDRRRHRPALFEQLGRRAC